jgi:aryl-alcohol dehydrogenase-like predicted oxidoreductase
VTDTPAGLMPFRPLGSSGLRISQLILGAMTFGEHGGVGAPISECQRMVDMYADAGGNMIDTAINYRGGESETIVGDVLAGRRDRFVVSTKFGVSRDGTDPNAAGSHRKNMRFSLETSLRKLKTDYIDVYWVHMHDRHTPLAETMRVLDDAVTAGKVLHVGVSDTPAWLVSRAMTLAEWRGSVPFVALQVPYSLVQRDIETEFLPMAEASGLTLTAWSPLGGGLLTGKYRDANRATGGTRLSAQSMTEHDLGIADSVAEVADEIGATSAQVAIAWTMHRSPIIHPIIGARTTDQLADNLGALNVELSADHLERLGKATGFVVGFPAEFISSTRSWVFGAADDRTTLSRAQRP